MNVEVILISGRSGLVEVTVIPPPMSLGLRPALNVTEMVTDMVKACIAEMEAPVSSRDVAAAFATRAQSVLAQTDPAAVVTVRRTRPAMAITVSASAWALGVPPGVVAGLGVAEEDCQSWQVGRIYDVTTGVMMQQKTYLDGQLHSDGDSPAVMEHDSTGVLLEECWAVYGQPHRDGGQPAIVRYLSDGRESSAQWYEHGKKHRVDGPAVVYRNDQGQPEHEEWWNRDRRHRFGGPAQIRPGGRRDYFVFGTRITEEQSEGLDGFRELGAPLEWAAAGVGITVPAGARFPDGDEDAVSPAGPGNTP